MADRDQFDPIHSPGEVDPKSFIRDTPAPLLPRTTQSVNINDFLLPDGAAPPNSSRAPASEAQLLNNLYTAPAYHPSQTIAAVAAAQQSTEYTPEAQEPQPEAVTPEAAVPEEAQFGVAEYHDPDQLVFDSDGNLVEREQPPAGDGVPKAKSPLVRFAAIGGILGIVFGAVVVLLTWSVGTPAGPYDLGNATSAAAGLNGHLFTKWDDNKVQYRLSIRPTDPDLHSAFALVVSAPPHPLSIGLQLKDAMGFVLCSRDVTLKYDDATAGADPMQLASAENQREQGKDFFQAQNGPDGKVESLNAQGTLPCSAAAYGKAVAWGFTPDFPSLAEQTDLMKQHVEKQVIAERAAAARKHPAQKPAERTLSFSIEGDNVVVGYDAGAGVLETNSAMSFFVERDGQSMTGWQNFPLPIHYHCDQTSVCTITRAGGGTPLRARMRK